MAKKDIKMMKPQIAERQSYNRLLRGERLTVADARRAANFVAKGKPAPKYPK